MHKYKSDYYSMNRSMITNIDYRKNKFHIAGPPMKNKQYFEIYFLLRFCKWMILRKKTKMMEVGSMFI